MMRDLEHPDITHVNLTGYTRLQTMPSSIKRCTTCRTEIGFTGEYYRLYDDMDFCCESHLVDWLIKNGEVVRMEVGVYH